MNDTFWLLFGCIIYRILGEVRGRAWRPHRCEDAECHWHGPIRSAAHRAGHEEADACCVIEECPRCGGDLVDVWAERQQQKRAKRARRKDRS